MSQKKIITAKNTDLTQWYTDVITKAQLVHYSSIKGMITFLPNSWAIWEQIQTYLNHRFRAIGIQNAAFPSLINASIFEKEKEHISGFNPELFKVTSVGDKQLSDPYVLRPTSEVIVSQVFRSLINTVSQLPILLNQWVSVFRAEKNPRPFLRNCEFYWQEIHGALATDEEAKNIALAILDIYTDLLQKVLLIPVLRGEKTPNERFAGASTSYTLEAIMPDGQALQCATSHVLGTSFSVAYDIKYQNSHNHFEYVKMISAGTSTRLLGGLILEHGDDFGLLVPFPVAPTQIVVNTFKANDSRVHEIAKKLYTDLNAQYRVALDLSEKSIGQKIIQNELIGVPIQIIVGPKEVENNSVCIYNRIDRSKKIVPLDNYHFYLKAIVDFWKNDYFAMKQLQQKSLICKISSYDELVSVLQQKKAALAPWGGSCEDENKLKKICGATARCITEWISHPSDKVKCFFSNQPAFAWVYFARAY